MDRNLAPAGVHAYDYDYVSMYVCIGGERGSLTASYRDIYMLVSIYTPTRGAAPGFV